MSASVLSSLLKASDLSSEIEVRVVSLTRLSSWIVGSCKGGVVTDSEKGMVVGGVSRSGAASDLAGEVKSDGVISFIGVVELVRWPARKTRS